MHQSAHPRNASPPPSALVGNEVPPAGAEPNAVAIPIPGPMPLGNGKSGHAGEGAPALPLLAVVVANVALAFGPWFVRLADVGPVAAAFWRMALAVDRLVDEPTSSIAEVARSVGYADPFAFSAAFKRVRGMNPRDFRREALGA